MDVPEEAMGDVSQLFQKRKGILTSYEPFPGQTKRPENVFAWNLIFQPVDCLEHDPNL
jgi:hypothetical protein